MERAVTIAYAPGSLSATRSVAFPQNQNTFREAYFNGLASKVNDLLRKSYGII